MNPHDPADTETKMETVRAEQAPQRYEGVPTIEESEPIDNVEPAIDEPDAKQTQLQFGHFDIRIPTSIQSSRSSMNQTSSGILEVLEELENEEPNTSDAVKHKSHQDLSAAGEHKEESKRSVFKSLLKRTHSAPKKIDVTVRPKSPTTPKLVQGELSPPVHVSCCHPFVDKIKTLADKQLHKNKVPKKPKIRTVAVENEQSKIVLAETTRIIRLKESPKADRKNVAAYMEKGDSDDIVEIIELDESPSESRKRREENRRAEEHAKKFVVPANVTQSVDIEPTIDELLEEEFKNDPPKKSTRRSKEHIYEDIQPVDDLPAPAVSIQSIVVQKPPEQNAALHEIAVEQRVIVAEELTEVPGASGLQEKEPSLPRPDEIIQISIEEAPDAEVVETAAVDENGNNVHDARPKLEAMRDATLGAAEKKVKFSQSTEEYQEKIAAERGPEKEDVELPEHLIKSKWSHMR